MAEENDVTRQDTMKGARGEWFLYLIAIFVVVALVASWAGGWFSDEARDVSAPVSTQPLSPQEGSGDEAAR